MANCFISKSTKMVEGEMHNNSTRTHTHTHKNNNKMCVCVWNDCREFSTHAQAHTTHMYLILETHVRVKKKCSSIEIQSLLESQWHSLSLSCAKLTNLKRCYTQQINVRHALWTRYTHSVVHTLQTKTMREVFHFFCYCRLNLHLIRFTTNL